MEALLERSSRGRGALAAIGAIALLGLLLATVFAPSAQARVESFQGLASSPVELTAFTADPTTGLMYAQEDGGTRYFRYDPRANAWSELPEAPLDSGNNGGAAYLNGKIYIVYTGNSTELSVYDIASNSWTTIGNPLGQGTGVIAPGNGVLYLAGGLKFVSYNPATNATTPLADPPKFPNSEGGEGFEPWGGLQVVGSKIYGHQGNGYTGFAVYDIPANNWQELPYVPEVPAEEGGDPEGPLLGSAYDPLTNTYITYGPYGGKSIFRFDIEAGSWSHSPLPFEVDDGGMAYLAQPGIEGIYMIQGEEGTQFARYQERNLTDLAPSMTAKVTKGGKFTYSLQIRNNGPERAGGIVLTSPLPKGVQLLSAITPQGTCAATTVLTCNLGTLPSGSTGTLAVQLKSRQKKVVNSVAVSSLALDSNVSNDSATLTTKQCVVPKVRNRRAKGAKKALRKSNCKPKVVRRFNAKKEEGKVVRASKGRGALLPAGSKVRVIVSKGPKG